MDGQTCDHDFRFLPVRESGISNSFSLVYSVWRWMPKRRAGFRFISCPAGQGLGNQNSFKGFDGFFQWQCQECLQSLGPVLRL